MFKEYNHKAIKYTNKEIVICLMKEVGERFTLIYIYIYISTLGGTDNVRVTVLSYICKFPNYIYSCEFEKKSGWSNPLKHLLTHWTPQVD